MKNCSGDFNFQRFDFYEKVFLYKVLWSPRISLETIHGRGSKIKYFACQKFRNPTYKTFLGGSSLNSSKKCSIPGFGAFLKELDGPKVFYTWVFEICAKYRMARNMFYTLDYTFLRSCTKKTLSQAKCFILQYPLKIRFSRKSRQNTGYF